jgi:hypothetical protein
MLVTGTYVQIKTCTCTPICVVFRRAHAHNYTKRTGIKMDLSMNEVQAAMNATDRFIDANGDCGLSFEAILSLCFIKATMAVSSAPAAAINTTAAAITRTVAVPASSGVPEWFADGVKRLQGRRLTASAIMKTMGRPTDMKTLRDAGVWLRSLYGEPMRSGGQTLFVIAGDAPPPVALEVDSEDAFAPGIPLASKAVNFAILKQTGLFKPEEIARQLGYIGSTIECMEIGKALTEQGFRYENGYFNVEKIR